MLKTIFIFRIWIPNLCYVKCTYIFRCLAIYRIYSKQKRKFKTSLHLTLVLHTLKEVGVTHRLILVSKKKIGFIKLCWGRRGLWNV